MMRKLGQVIFTRGWLLLVAAAGVCTSGCFYDCGHGGWHHHHHHDW